MLKRILILLIPVACLVFLGLGYWLGTQKTERVMAGATAEKMRSEIIEAQSDSAVLQILAQQRYKDAENIAKMRYYNRVLAISELAAAEPSMAPRANEVIQEAKQGWKQAPYVMPNPADNAKLMTLME